MRLLIGVSGGIAAYKALETARLAVRAGHSVRVIQTPTSRRFVGKASFAGITGAPVLTSEFEADPARGTYPGEPLPERAPISHLALVERADIYLIAPASANTIAKLATGQADNIVTTAALAAACPVVIAPAMNNRMYLNPATQANLRMLSERGITIVPPGEGELASHGERGIGRLAEPPALLAACEALLGPDTGDPATLSAATATESGDESSDSWSGVSVLVTAGGTREPIDSVRYIGNRSSGRMGYALAAAAVSRGAEVTLVAANVHLDPPAGVRVIPVATARELGAACHAEFPRCNVLLMAAAVADFRPAAPATHKLKKTSPQAPREIALEETEDILGALAATRKAGQVLVGFAAEHGEEALEYGRSKLERKGLDAIVINDISRSDIGFDSEENEVTVVRSDGQERQIRQASKRAVADAILDQVQVLRSGEHDGATERATLGRG